MLRFYRGDISEMNGIQVLVANKCVFLNEDVWECAREYFKCSVSDDTSVIRILPVMDERQEIMCYAYQDSEANRELRMLKELEGTKEALQFEDVFPDIRKVRIYGCNELAYCFAEYLENRHIKVSVTGKYWSCVGYTEQIGDDIPDQGELVICAEDIFQRAGLDQLMVLSASPDFECIDKIYEENIRKGIIKDSRGGVEYLWEKLNKKKIVLLGTSLKEQDTYDLLCEYGIDIEAFVDEKNAFGTLLGKRVISLEQALVSWKNIVFIECAGKNSAWGNPYIELLDYFGYMRNEQVFLINDYAEIPFSNLVHVMNGKKVLLTGDECLCGLLADYLYAVEGGNVEVRYTSMGQKVPKGEDWIRCLVIPQSKNERKNVDVANASLRNKLMVDMGFDNYTEYFMRHRAFVLIDKYLKQNREKYTIAELTPKGIFLGRIPSYSGNVFFREIMEEHPEVLSIPYSDLNNNLFYYCIRLVEYDSDEILTRFWEMYDTEAASREKYFTDVSVFEASLKRLLKYKRAFTSQELFVMFHVAYAEMYQGKRFGDVSNLVIYWEPHYISRDEFPFFALWLEDKKVNGHTVRLRRDNLTRAGSYCDRAVMGRYEKMLLFYVLFLEDVDNDTVGQRCQSQYWVEHKLRFEDIKLYPREMIRKVCGWLGISWADSMIKATGLEGLISYLHPVFKKNEAVFSEFDRFRIAVACSLYQKKYGYTYENCMKFSRKELQEIFLKPFWFEEQGAVAYNAEEYRKIQEQVRWSLWNIRKHMILDDIGVEFKRFELK